MHLVEKWVSLDLGVAAQHLTERISHVREFQDLDMRTLHLSICGALMALGFNVVVSPEVADGLPVLGMTTPTMVEVVEKDKI